MLTRADRLSSFGELAASIAHEIKNPLISIQGFAKRIADSSDPEKMRDYARFVEKESQRVSDVLLRLLDFSHMSEPEKERLDLNGIVDDTLLFAEHHLTRFKHIDLTVEKEENLPEVYADKIHLQQALLNIIMNGAQAMPEGGPLVIRTGVRASDWVWLSVSDKGTGIEPKDLDKIFDPFFTTKKKGVGTGLGLSLTKKLVEANKGKLEVESVKGQGSTFRILLPLSGAAAFKGRQAPPAALAVHPRLPSRRRLCYHRLCPQARRTMKFSVLDTDLGAVLLFAREIHLWRLDLVPSGPADARQRAAAEFPEAQEGPAASKPRHTCCDDTSAASRWSSISLWIFSG